MPLFEEKLVSPLAIRFTQEFVRTTFQDGRDLEASIAAIKAEPVTGDYDVVLRAPFPLIEVVRWRQKARRGGGCNGYSGDVSSGPEEHWFTFDNRRLYCLQRAAVALWPRRAAVAVEVLYAAASAAVFKKCDTTTGGLSVALGLSPNEPTDWWEWQRSLPSGVAEPASSLAQRAVAADEAKSCVADLADAPSAPSALTRLLRGSGLAPCCEADAAAAVAAALAGPGFAPRPQSKQNERTRCATPSTRPDSGESEPGSGEEGQGLSVVQATAPEEQARRLAAVRKALGQEWLGSKGETYRMRSRTGDVWICMRSDDAGSKRFTLTWEADTGRVWWGTAGSLFLEAADLLARPDRVAWYAGALAEAEVEPVGWRGGRRGPKPRSVWQKAGALDEAAHATAAAADQGAMADAHGAEGAAGAAKRRPRRRGGGNAAANVAAKAAAAAA